LHSSRVSVHSLFEASPSMVSPMIPGAFAFWRPHDAEYATHNATTMTQIINGPSYGNRLT
jgi:hypothetical protein